MLPLLFDKGLPPQVAESFRCLDLNAEAVGHREAPPSNASDETNCLWCKTNGNAVLVTNDRGRKDKTILQLLRQHQVHAIFVHNDLRFASRVELARALLKSEHQMEQIASRHTLYHRLKPSGRLEKWV